MRVEVNRLSDALGAEITGVDLRQPPDEALARTLNECLLEHIVLVIRDQTLTPGEYVAAMRTFGVPGHQTQVGQVMAEHPEIWEIDSREALIGAQGQRIIYGGGAGTLIKRTKRNRLRLPRFTPCSSRRAAAILASPTPMPCTSDYPRKRAPTSIR